MTAVRCAIYVRISQDQNGERLGVTRQLDDCLALADRLGWEVVARFDDNDISAFNGKHRPGFQSVQRHAEPVQPASDDHHLARRQDGDDRVGRPHLLLRR